VVLSVALGVGANTAIFSLLDAAILKRLPVRNPESLLIVEWRSQGFPNAVSNINGEFTRISANLVRASSIGANLYRRLAREQTAFDALVAIADPNSMAIVVDGAPADQVSLQYVGSNFFQGLGAAPTVGRPFRDDEDRVGHEPVVIVSHRLWIQRLGGSTEALARSIRINNVPARIVGVSPAGFFGLRAG